MDEKKVISLDTDNSAEGKAMQEQGEKIMKKLDKESASDGGKTYAKAEAASVKTVATKMSKGDDLKGVRLTCDNGD